MIRVISFIIIYLFYAITSCFAQIKTEEILLKNNKVELPGTLTFTNKKQPLVIWVHGSGQIDRNGNQPAQNIKANYIKQFRDKLNKKEIAFFSYDKRTANKNNIKNLKKRIVFEDFATDVKTVVNHFKKNKHFSNIILVGHSQGSLVAMLSLENVDKFISLAGASKTIDNIMVEQISRNNAIMGTFVKSHFKELKETGIIKNVNPMLKSIFSKQNLPFLKSWIAYNPSKEIQKITKPTLIINGTKDLQVSVEEAKNLHKANPNAKLAIIDNMNHALKNIEKDEDNLKSYFSSDYELSKELIKTVVSFINQ